MRDDEQMPSERVSLGVTFSDLLMLGIAAFATWARLRTDARELEPTNDDAAEAAALLGVDLAATPDQIRAALRAKMRASRTHPDQGGDAEEAKRLIAAQNLLIERARASK